MYEGPSWKESACQTVLAFSKHSGVLFKVSLPAYSFQSSVLLLKGYSVGRNSNSTPLISAVKVSAVLSSERQPVIQPPAYCSAVAAWHLQTGAGEHGSTS